MNITITGDINHIDFFGIGCSPQYLANGLGFCSLLKSYKVSVLLFTTIQTYRALSSN